MYTSIEFLIVADLSARNKFLVIVIKYYKKGDIKVFWPFPIFLGFLFRVKYFCQDCTLWYLIEGMGLGEEFLNRLFLFLSKIFFIFIYKNRVYILKACVGWNFSRNLITKRVGLRMFSVEVFWKNNKRWETSIKRQRVDNFLLMGFQQ